MRLWSAADGGRRGLVPSGHSRRAVCGALRECCIGLRMGEGKEGGGGIECKKRDGIACREGKKKTRAGPPVQKADGAGKVFHIAVKVDEQKVVAGHWVFGSCG